MKKSPADVLADTGRALYGEHWRLALSRGVEVDDDTIRRWMSGRTILTPEHGVFDDALTLLRNRQKELALAEKQLTGWLNANRK